MVDNCIFCKIVAGQIPSKKLHEDEEFLAFHDIHPAAPVHFLVIPKTHVATLAACETDEKWQGVLGRMVGLATRLARQEGLAYDEVSHSGGFKTVINTGPGGGQEVYHLHIHVLGGPRPWAAR